MINRTSTSDRHSVLQQYLLFTAVSFAVFLVVVSSIIIPKVQSTYADFLLSTNTLALDLEVQDVKIFVDDRVTVLRDIASQQPVITAAMLADGQSLEASSLLNSSKILGTSAPLILFDIDGLVLYSTEATDSEAEAAVHQMARSILSDQIPQTVELVENSSGTYLLIAVPVLYGAGTEGILGTVLPFKVADIVATGLREGAAAVKLSTERTTLSWGTERIVDPFSQNSQIEPYGITLTLINDITPFKNQEAELIKSYSVSLAIAALVAFAFITLVGFRLIIAPFQQLLATDAELSRQRRDLQLIFDNVPVRIWYKDDKNRILRLNREAANSMGRKVENTEGQDTYDLFPEMAKKYHDDDLAVINSGKAMLGIVEEYTPVDGERGWVRTDKVPFVDEENGERGVFVVSQDITDVIAAQEDLRDSEERFALAAQGASVGIWDWIDVNDDKEYWSPQFFKLLGYENEEIEANLSVFRDLLHPDDHEHTFAALDAHFTRKEPFDAEYRLKTKQGSYRWFRGSGQASWDEEGRAVRMVGSVQDIHTLKSAEKNLTAALAEQSELTNRLSTIIDTAADAIIIIDPKGAIQTFNKSAQKLFGYSEAEVTGKNVRILMPDPDKGQHDGYLTNYLSTKKPKIIGMGREVTGRRKHGDKFPMELSVGEISENSATAGFVGIIRDISARVKAEQILQGHVKDLARSNADLEQFAYIASHDLKAPLRGIMNLADWIQENIQETADEETNSYLSLLKNRISRLESLLAGLLEYSRVGEGSDKLAKTDLNMLVEVAADLLEAQNKGFEINCELPAIVCSSSEMNQIFQNLISNTVKHNEAAPCRVEIGCSLGDGEYVFRFEDRGIGIPEDMWDKVFKMFQTLKPRDQVEGSGMGLAIVKKIVTRRGGRIWIEEPVDGSGVAFCFSFPKVEKK